MAAAVVGILIILARAGSSILEPRQAVAGFASEPPIVVARVFAPVLWR